MQHFTGVTKKIVTTRIVTRNTVTAALKLVTALKHIRKKLGIRQQRMAEYLGVSRSLIAMVEAGQRVLPPGAYQKLVSLELQLAQQAASARPMVEGRDKEILSVLQKREKECLRQLRVLQRKLEKLSEQRDRCTTALTHLAGLSSDDLVDKHWAGMYARDIHQRLKAAGKGKITLLAARIKGLEAELEVLGTSIAKLKG